MKSESLNLSKEVLEEREKLELNLNTLLPAIDIGLNKLEEIRQHEVFVRKHEADIEAGKDFKTTATRIRDRKEILPPGEHYTETYTVTSKELKELYMKGKKQKKKTLTFLSCIKDEFRLIESNVASKITTIRKSLNRLNEIALKPDPITDVQYIDLLIESEKKQVKEGFHGRIHALEKLKKHAEITKEVVASHFKPFDRKQKEKNVTNENNGDDSSVDTKENKSSAYLTTSDALNLEENEPENGISEEDDSNLSENTEDNREATDHAIPSSIFETEDSENEISENDDSDLSENTEDYIEATDRVTLST
ncbi:bicaudal D-related protein homolog, partial [Saccostrea cucullata]|uniref:bicaudal D-related protein homolog n=1 Tax=Saccostrea cuccullata TaxID=36930 RepID=UPI002ED0BDA9